MKVGDLIRTNDTVYNYSSPNKKRRIGIIVYLFDSFGVPYAHCWLNEYGFLDLHMSQFKVLEGEC